MSSSAPWMPSQGAATEAAGAGDNGPAHSQAASQEQIDPNDPRLTSEPLDVAVDKDAYSQPVPPPDGIWKAKLKLEGIKLDNGERKDYQVSQTKRSPILPYFQTSISASLVDVKTGRFDGITVYPAFGGYVSTLTRKDHSSTVATVLSKLTRPDGKPWVTTAMARISAKDWIDMLVQALAGEPYCGIETQWEWTCAVCSTEFGELRAKGQSEKYAVSIRGMNRFPAQQDKVKRANGDMFDPEMKCQANQGHGYSRAYAKLVRFLSLAEVK